MSEKTGDKNFQRMALGLMALTGLGTLLHAAHEIWRDIKPKREPARQEPPYQPPTPSYAQEQTGGQQHDESPRRSWVETSRVQEPKPVERHSRSEQHSYRPEHPEHAAGRAGGRG